jgi:hypothetical protein
MTDEEMDLLEDSAAADQLQEVDQVLGAWPGESPPDALVARTLAAVADEQAAVLSPPSVVDPSDTSPPRFPWMEVAAVLLVASLLASAFVVQFGGKVKALFETSDTEVDTVDSGL